MSEAVPATNVMTAGQRVTLTITDIAFGGEGVGRVDQFVVFVPFVAQGEQVEAELAEVKKSFARAKLIRVIQPSALRVEPKCRYFGECGGCQYQHNDNTTQLEQKHKQISDLIERIGGFPRSIVSPVDPCPQP